ncbi:hypothetical protein [Geodermatophilus sp. SYSU D00710]
MPRSSPGWSSWGCSPWTSGWWPSGRARRPRWWASLGGSALVLTRALVQVAAFLAALGALAFAVEVVVDPATRSPLVRDLVDPGPG